ncbi:MAG: hypothetical protein GXY07_04265 [Candidatus Hydrogenedentes bacterium]|nr:hypothetical protein [Candidatus Hydrogenedentota bacterium]
MSSILDALNKLEQEKSSRQAETADTIVPATPEEAAAELLGEASFDNGRPGAVRAWAPVLAALMLGAAITAVTVVITVWLVAKPGETVAAVPVTEAETPLVHKYTIPVQVETAVTEEENTPPPAAEEPVPAVVAADPASPRVEEPKPALQPETKAPPLPAPAPEPAPEITVAEVTPPVVVPEPVPPPAPKPEPEVAVAAAPLSAVAPEPPAPVIEAAPSADEHPLPDMATLMRQQELARAESTPSENGALAVAEAAPSQRSWTPTPSPAEPPAARPDSGPVDMNALPRMSTQDRESLGLDNLRLNVLRPADKDQPDALAIINLKKVYVGEMIPGTRARLIGVEANAIGVEVNSGGGLKRYRIPR